MYKSQPVSYGKRLYAGDISEAPSFAETWKNTLLRDVSPITMATVERLRFDGVPVDEDFDFVSAVTEDPFLEYNAHHLAHAKNSEHFYFLASSLRENQERRDTLENAGLFNSIAAEFLNPINFVFAFPAIGAVGTAVTTAGRIAQAGYAGAKAGLAGGLATEAIRYPFDQLETREEALTNIAASTAFGGALGAGIPAVARLVISKTPGLRSRMGEDFDYAEERLVDMQENGIDLHNVNIEEITSGPRMSVVETPPVKGRIDPETGEIFEDVERSFAVQMNTKLIEKEFKSGAFASPEVSGGKGLPRTAFEDVKMYQDFLFNKERRLQTETRSLKETDDEFIDRINALARSDAVSGYGTTDNWFTKHHFAGSPVFRALRDEDMPEGIKMILANQTGNNQIALKRNLAGYGTNAVDQRMGQFNAKFRALSLKVEDIWSKSKTGKEAFRMKALGVTQTNLPFQEGDMIKWFEGELDTYIDVREGVISKDSLTELQKELHKYLKEFFQDFLKMSQDEGMLLGLQSYDSGLNDLARMIDDMKSNEASIVDRVGLEKYEADLRSIQNKYDELKELKRSARNADNYNIPRFYNIIKLTRGKRAFNAGLTNEDAAYYLEFVDLLTDEFTQTPIYKIRNDAGELVDNKPNPRDEAFETIDKIINDGHEPVFFSGTPRTKHLKQRAINLPDNKLKKFLVKDLSIFGKYAEAQGFNISWRSMFGQKTLDDVLDDIEIIGKDAGTDPNKISFAKRAFLGDYLRTTGMASGSPHRWDNQIYQVASTMSAVTRLAASGITAFGDLANTIAARPFFPMVRDLGRDLPALIEVIKDVDEFAEVLSLHPNLVKEQLMADAKTGVQPSLADRITYYPDKLWFKTPIIGNDLLPVTSATRYIAAAYNTSDIVKLIVKSGGGEKLTKSQQQQMGTLGLNPKVVKNIYTQLMRKDADGNTVFQTSESKRIHLANSRKWDLSTREGRDALSAFTQAIDIATDAQVIMAKNFDKPLVVDGVTFVRWHPIMKVMGMKVDERVTVDGIKYAKVGSGFFKFPFQFMNYTFGATNSVVGRSADPMQERRMQHIAASVAGGLLLLYITKPWMFKDDAMSYKDIAIRAVDRSGVTGIYGDLMFEGIHAATAAGVDPDKLPFRGKYRPTSKEKYDVLLGPAPTQVRDLTIAARDYYNNQSSANAKKLSRELAYLHILGHDLTARDLLD